jgi:hypothetical protein
MVAALLPGAGRSLSIVVYRAPSLALSLVAKRAGLGTVFIPDSRFEMDAAVLIQKA